MSTATQRVVHSLTRAEAEINLLARCQPKNWAELQAKLPENWCAGDRRAPAFEFAVAPEFGQLRRALEKLEKWIGGRGPWGDIWSARARELMLEAEMAENVGKERILRLAPGRFGGSSGTTERALRRLARCWATSPVEASDDVTIASDDETNPGSLLVLMRRELEKAGIHFRVRLCEGMAARAAVDETTIWIKPRIYLRQAEARRVVVHEIYGHAIRRRNGRSRENFLFRCGVTGADADEEGRALWLEEQAGLLQAMRRVELGKRHLAADACRRGASFSDTVDLLLGLETPLEQALSLGLRVWRGGGIAREFMYLPGYWRARRALGDSPQIDTWMKRGRLSFDVAARLTRGELELPERD